MPSEPDVPANEPNLELPSFGFGRKKKRSQKAEAAPSADGGAARPAADVEQDTAGTPAPSTDGAPDPQDEAGERTATPSPTAASASAPAAPAAPPAPPAPARVPTRPTPARPPARPAAPPPARPPTTPSQAAAAPRPPPPPPPRAPGPGGAPGPPRRGAGPRRRRGPRHGPRRPVPPDRLRQRHREPGRAQGRGRRSSTRPKRLPLPWTHHVVRARAAP